MNKSTLWAILSEDNAFVVESRYGVRWEIGEALSNQGTSWDFWSLVPVRVVHGFKQSLLGHVILLQLNSASAWLYRQNQCLDEQSLESAVVEERVSQAILRTEQVHHTSWLIQQLPIATRTLTNEIFYFYQT